MGFELVEPIRENALQGRALGVSTISFRPIYLSLDQAKENVKNLLLTRKGERIMQPNLGSDLMRVLFEPNISELKDVIQEVITEPITFWLPYIDIDNIDIETSDENPSFPHHIKIVLTFSLNEIETQTITFIGDTNGTVTVSDASGQLTGNN